MNQDQRNLAEEAANKEKLHQERNELLTRVQDWLEVPMIILGFVWLVLLVVELTGQLSPMLQLLNNVIWALFILDFAVKFIVAPAKLPFLKANVLTAISLLIPALRIFRLARVFRIFRAVRFARGLRLVKVISSINRSMRSLGASMSRRGFGYILALSVVVLLAGAAGMYAFEIRNPMDYVPTGALWWTAMLLISIGSEYWPQTPEGRALCFILSLYGFGVFGYFTATLATFFIGRDAEDNQTEIAGAGQVEGLREEIAGLRAEIRTLLRQQTGNLPDQTQTPGAMNEKTSNNQQRANRH